MVTTMSRSFRTTRMHDKSMFLPSLIMVIFVLLVSFAIAIGWQKLAGAPGTVETGSPRGAAENQPGAGGEIQANLISGPKNPEPVSSSEPEPPPPPKGGLVPLSATAVGAEYFSDAVFVGDSITTGISLYGVMSNTNVMAGTGVGISTAYTAEVVKQADGTRITIIDALRQQQYKKVYVMLGGNELRDESKETFLKHYGKLIDDLLLLQPEAAIYIQSVLPVTQYNKYSMNNTQIDDCNAALLELCKQKGVYYLNVAECMKDAQGMLPNEASPADGMHFGPEYYNKWFDYLKIHTADEPLAAPKGV